MKIHFFLETYLRATRTELSSCPVVMTPQENISGKIKKGGPRKKRVRTTLTESPLVSGQSCCSPPPLLRRHFSKLKYKFNSKAAKTPPRYQLKVRLCTPSLHNHRAHMHCTVPAPPAAERAMHAHSEHFHALAGVPCWSTHRGGEPQCVSKPRPLLGKQLRGDVT